MHTVHRLYSTIVSDLRKLKRLRLRCAEPSHSLVLVSRPELLSFETGNRGGKQKLRQFQTPLEAVEHLGEYSTYSSICNL